MPRKADENSWFGLGPVVFGLIAVHLAALLFWILALWRTSRSAAAAAKPASKRH